MTLPIAHAITDVEWSLFLEQLALEPNVSKACRAAGISGAAAYSKRSNDADFRRAWDEALNESVDRVEEELHRRAVLGVDEPVFYQGEKCGVVRKYSDSLLSLYIKRWRHEYRDRSTVDMNAKVEETSELTAAQKREMIRQIIAEEVAAREKRESDLG